MQLSSNVPSSPSYKKDGNRRYGFPQPTCSPLLSQKDGGREADCLFPFLPEREKNNNKILIRVEATPLSRTILRVEKLKQSWYNGLFSSLFSLLERIEGTTTLKALPKQVNEALHCHNCGNRVDKDTIICPYLLNHS